jgi:hypothetical protein
LAGLETRGFFAHANHLMRRRPAQPGRRRSSTGIVAPLQTRDNGFVTVEASQASDKPVDGSKASRSSVGPRSPWNSSPTLSKHRNRAAFEFFC